MIWNEQFTQSRDKGNGWHNIEAGLITLLTIIEPPATAKHYTSYLKGIEITRDHLKRSISTSVKAYDNCLTH